MNFKTYCIALGLALGTAACGGLAEDAAYGSGAGGYGGYDGGADDGQGAVDDEPIAPPEDDPDETIPEPSECNATDEVTLYLSPDDSNSMSSPVQAREAVLDGFDEIRGVPIRTWEFMNYYTFDYPAAEVGGVNVIPSLMQPEGADEGEFVLQIAVTSERVAASERAPMNITLVLDTSGSMEGHAMDMLKASSRAIAGSLDEGDTISMVEWDTQNQIVLAGYQVQSPNDPTVLEHIEALRPGGGTDLHGGLVAGYDLAQQVYDPARINRIVLISDGGANAGVTDVETIAMHAGGNDSEGIYMVGVGVGTASSYHDDLMDVVTDAGKGASVFINDEDEAQRILGEQFVSTFDVAVRDVQVQLDMPPGFEVVRFSGEEISTDPDEVEPQHLAPNDTMLFHQHISTCAPQLLEDETTFSVTVRYEDGTTFTPRETQMDVMFRTLLQTDDPLLLKGAAVFEYAEGLKAYQNREVQPLDAAFRALALAEEANPEDSELAEIREVLEAL